MNGIVRIFLMNDVVSVEQKHSVDAIHIATPHPFHCAIGCQALEAGLHVMMEKPLAVHKAECEKLIDAYQDKSKVFAAMFNQRTDPLYRKLKDLIDSGDLGVIRRTSSRSA